MKSKKWMLVFFVLLIGMFFLPEVYGLAEEGSVPKVLCSYPYNVFYGVGLDEVIKETACGLESDGEGNAYYVIEGQMMRADEDFVAGLMNAFGTLPFADVAEMNAMLAEAGSLDFEMVDGAGVVTTVEILDEYMGEIRLKRLINETYAEYVGFYQDNINTDVLYLGDLGFLLNDTYELSKSTLTVHLLDPMTWYEVEWLERSLVFDLGDDFEMVKEMVFSNEFNEKYVDYLRMDLMTKDSLEQTRNNMLANGYYEDDVEYRLRNLGLGREVDGDWMKISLTNGIVLGLIFDEDMQQIEIWESFDRLDVPIATLGLVEGIDNGGPGLEGMNEFQGSIYDPFADFTELEFFNGRIIYQAKGIIKYSGMFRFPINNSNWDKIDEIQRKIFNEWISGKPEREKYLFSIDQLNTSDGMLAIDAMIIDNRSVFLDLLEKSFNEDLFLFGEIADFNDRAVFLSQILSYNDLGFYSSEQSQKIYFLGDNYDSVKKYFLSEEYSALLNERNVDSYEIIEKGVENPEVGYLRFSLDGVGLSISFYDKGEQVSIKQFTQVMNMDFE